MRYALCLRREFVNGKIAIDNNKLTDTRAGRPLKNQ
jgi:hypothetical protein